MKWSAQVAHVARKDVREFRWMIAAYAVVVAGGAAVLGGSIFDAGDPVLWTFARLVMGILLVAVLVQADSPARSTPFWITLPLRPSAVFTAKLVVGVLVVLGFALVGQAATLSAHAVAAGDLPGLLGRSAIAFGFWLGMAAVIAALAPDLRTFLLALMLTTLGTSAASWWLPDSARDPGPPSLLIPMVELCCMVLLAAHQYLTRRVRRGVAAGVLLWAAGLLVPLVAPAPIFSADVALGDVPAPLRASTFNVDSVDFHSGSKPMMMLRVKGWSPVHHYVLVSPVVELRMADGSSAPVRLSQPFISFGADKVRMDGIRWLNESQLAHEIGMGESLEVTPGQRRALEQGRARLSVRGHVEVREPRVKMDLPVIAGAAAARQGLRMRVIRAEVDAQGPSVEVRRSSVASSIRDTWESGAAPTHVLVNRSRGEGIIMGIRQSDGSGTGGAVSIQAGTTVLGPQIPLDLESGMEAGWLNGARLLVLEWVPRGSYPLAIEQRSP